MPPLFEVQNLHVSAAQGHLWKRDIVPILHGVNFMVEPGESVAYLGQNGAGKTTTFRAICGLSSRYHGKILWQGKEVLPQQLHRKIGFLPENPYFYPSLTPREILREMGHLAGIRGDLSKRIDNWSGRLHFSHILDQQTRTCSKGQLQRVGLALALLHDPALLILDEPMSGLDPLGRELVRNVLKEAVDNGTSLLFSSHILNDAENLCNSVVALQNGRVIYSGRLRELLQYTNQWYIRIKTGNKNIDGLELQDVVVTPEAEDIYLLEGSGGQNGFNLALKQYTQLEQVEIIEANRRVPRLEDAFLKLVEEHES